MKILQGLMVLFFAVSLPAVAHELHGTTDWFQEVLHHILHLSEWSWFFVVLALAGFVLWRSWKREQ